MTYIVNIITGYRVICDEMKNKARKKINWIGDNFMKGCQWQMAWREWESRLCFSLKETSSHSQARVKALRKEPMVCLKNTGGQCYWKLVRKKETSRRWVNKITGVRVRVIKPYLFLEQADSEICIEMQMNWNSPATLKKGIKFGRTYIIQF